MRWELNRAGILNVYQYGDEVLTFGGGRLLLRGVNGSGKSTAMNMLLPFLLDGDTRRIDAAGEQSGVLKSWMLSDRDDPQPTGYLWIEFAKGDEYLTCGCGIRANRASDNVSTWWWITPRRPHVDLDLVQDRRPLNAEGLRAVIGADAVFRQEDRRIYREELRRRLFGGAELDQHIRLLHVVRSPRVGDRVDQEIPEYLHGALPQLSEAALTDAAQPLDDLEEHRRNVSELRRTSETLSALHQVYGDYCRSELRRHADKASDLCGSAESSRRAATRAAADLRQATVSMEAAAAQVASFEQRERALEVELQGLRDLPAYKEGLQLDDLRDHVKGAGAVLARAEDELGRLRDAEGRSKKDHVNAERAGRQDHVDLRSVLAELSAEAVAAGLTTTAPDLPALVTKRVGDGEPEAPGQLPDGPVRDRLSLLRAAAQHRSGDIEEVRDELRVVAASRQRLEAAIRDLDAAEVDLQRRRDVLTERVSMLDGAVRRWRVALTGWLDHLEHQLISAGLSPPAGVDLHADLAARRVEVAVAFRSDADRLVTHRQTAVAAGRVAVDNQQSEVDAASAEVAKLEALSVPEPPSQPWQRPGRDRVLAELVDFAEGASAETRAAIEAAMEAAGLLSAEVQSNGAVINEDGMLIASPQTPVVEHPLSCYLVVEPNADPIVGRVLDSVSTDPHDLARDGATVVTLDGRFRVGNLTGRYHKTRAEHVGLSARREQLERLKRQARQRLAEEAKTLADLQRRQGEFESHAEDAISLRGSLPDDREVADAVLALSGAREEAQRAEDRRAQRANELRLAEDAHSEAVDKSRRVAANLSLTDDETSLRRVESAVRAAVSAVDRAEHALQTLSRSIDEWRRAAARWADSRAAVVNGDAVVEEARQRLEGPKIRLATLEAQFGEAYEETLAAVRAHNEELSSARDNLKQAHDDQLTRTGDVATARSRLEEQTRRAEDDERRALSALADLRRVLDVPGLVASISPETDWAAAPVEESVPGIKRLASLMREHAGRGREVAADGVRQSLRQRRDSLGAGWDASDRQPDESLPLMVEINGPEGRLPLADAARIVQKRLSEMSALLTTEQDGALRNLLQGLVAREVADKLQEAVDLVERMNRRLDLVTTTHGIGVSIRWRRRDGLDPERSEMVTLLAKQPDLRTPDEDARLRALISSALDYSRREQPDTSYSDLVGRILDYRSWYEMILILKRPGRTDERLSRRTPLSEGEKKIVSYLPLFAAVAASCDSLADVAPDAPRFLLLDDAFAKVSEDNHPKLFGLLVELDLDFIATSERLWGTYATVPELAITEVVRDASLGVVVLEHSRWDGNKTARHG